MIKNRIANLTQNRDFKNIIFSLLSYCITPIVLIISTPLLLRQLGEESYGLWILINSVLNLLAISNFGLGNAFIKLGSEYTKDGDRNKYNELFGVSLTISIFLALIINILTMLFGTYLVPILFNDGGLETINATLLLLSGIVGLRIINSIISGSYMAKQRYDINSKVIIIFNLITSILFTILAVIYGNLKTLVLFLFISTVVLTVMNCFVAMKVVPGIKFKLEFRKDALKKIFTYGIYSWLQLIISSLNAQADKLIIGGLLGAKALGFYIVCMQLVIKIHEIPAAVGGFLFVKFSSLNESKETKKIRDTYVKALKISILFVIVSSTVAFIFAKMILSIWISKEFAEQHYILFQILVISVSLGAIGVVPYYYLNGTGFVRLNTVISLLTTATTVGLYFVLIPYFGVNGTGYARFIGVPLVVFSLYYANKNLYKINEGNSKHDISKHQYQI